MPSFQFRMERLLRVRRIQEELARSEWIAALHQQELADGRVERTRKDGRAAEMHLREQLAPGRPNPGDILSSLQLERLDVLGILVQIV